MPVLEATGRIRGWRGQQVDALVEELEALAGHQADPYTRYSAVVVRADLTFAQGDLQAAATAYRRAADDERRQCAQHVRARRTGMPVAR